MPLAHTTIYALDAQDVRLSWALDEAAPHDIAASEGAWALVSLSDGRQMLVRYDARMRAGRAVPAFVERMLRERSLDQLLTGLERMGSTARFCRGDFRHGVLATSDIGAEASA